MDVADDQRVEAPLKRKRERRDVRLRVRAGRNAGSSIRRDERQRDAASGSIKT